MKRGLAVILLFTLLFGFSSCNTHKQLLYMQHDTSTTAYKPSPSSYVVAPHDELYIQVTSMLNKDINTLFSNSSNSGNMSSYTLSSDVGVYVNTYSVSDSGYIEVPLIGKIKVQGKTIPQITEEVKKKAAEYVNDAVVVVKLMSFRVTVIGEVKRPVVITNYHDKLTILEAIAQAGDLTDFANRKSVTLVRYENGQNTTFNVDLTSKSILSNPGYYLQPGDVIVIEPRPGKTTQMNLPTYSIFLSTLSTLILLLNFVVK